ncbi:hypothetical protein PGT21_022693 [Puccinia graminis f. sp. tritici]|uniref:Uncharacterized protein n=1 Tax=Puccinia graminis f. sp. tritici TaxID=56615 RepID=A0A5B0NJV2_PUCGR|nr:hypothetical protein PGT21_022693 [Puccinia graminis f. sp. tritici]
MKNSPQVNSTEETQMVLAEPIDHEQIMRANAQQIETDASTVKQLKANYEGQLNKWSFDANNDLRAFQMKIDLSDEAKTSKLQDIKDKFQDALRRISDLEKKAEVDESAQTRLQIQDANKIHKLSSLDPENIGKDLQLQQEELDGIKNVLDFFEKVEVLIHHLKSGVDQSLERTGSFDQRLRNLEEQLVQASEQKAAAGTTNNMKDLETAITALQDINLPWKN